MKHVIQMIQDKLHNFQSQPPPFIHSLIKNILKVCNDDTCPDWTPWTEWTQCTQTCGGGTKKRSRDCVTER